jgi:hypothetical protein
LLNSSSRKSIRLRHSKKSVCGSKTNKKTLFEMPKRRTGLLGFACFASQNKQKREESRIPVRTFSVLSGFSFRGELIRRPPRN